MTDATPDRTIGGLAKREMGRDLSGMLARNRTAKATTPTADEKPAKPTEAVTSTQRTNKKATAKTTTPPNAPTSADTSKTQVTAYMSHEVRNRARAAFKATAHLEGDRNWSAFIEAAVLAETQRREQQHNDGKPYAGGEEALSPGRTIR